MSQSLADVISDFGNLPDGCNNGAILAVEIQCVDGRWQILLSDRAQFTARAGKPCGGCNGSSIYDVIAEMSRQRYSVGDIKAVCEALERLQTITGAKANG